MSTIKSSKSSQESETRVWYAEWSTPTVDAPPMPTPELTALAKIGELTLELDRQKTLRTRAEVTRAEAEKRAKVYLLEKQAAEKERNEAKLVVTRKAAHTKTTTTRGGK